MLDRTKSQFVTQWWSCGVNFDDLDQLDQLEKMKTKNTKKQKFYFRLQTRERNLLSEQI